MLLFSLFHLLMASIDFAKFISGQFPVLLFLYYDPTLVIQNPYLLIIMITNKNYLLHSTIRYAGHFTVG